MIKKFFNWITSLFCKEDNEGAYNIQGFYVGTFAGWKEPPDPWDPEFGKSPFNNGYCTSI